LKWHYCRHCDRIQRFRHKCLSCGKRCEEVDVPRHRAQVATPVLALPILILGMVGFFSRSFVHSMVDGSSLCCTVIMLLYFMILVSVLSLSIFNYFRYRKWTKEVAREMVEEGIVVETRRWERVDVYEEDIGEEPVVPRRKKGRRREAPPGRERRRKRRPRRRSRYDEDDEDWDLDDEWLY